MTITQSNEILYREAVSKYLQGKTYNNFVDLGSGDGSTTKPIADLIKAQRVSCVDHDYKQLVKAKKQGYYVLQGDLNNKIPIKSRTANLVLANQVIEHIAKTDLFINEIVRILAPGGELLICTPNLASWHNVGALVLGYQPFSSQVSDQYFLGNPLHPLYKRRIFEAQAHLRIFTPRSLSDLCQVHALKIIHMEGVGYYPLKGYCAKIMSKIDSRHSAYILLVAQKVN